MRPAVPPIVRRTVGALRPSPDGRVAGVWRAVTPLGRAVGATGLLAWAGAAWLGWRELAVVAAACLLGLVVGVAMLSVGGAKLAVLLELGTKRVVVGEAASTRVEARNPSGRRTLPVRLETRVGKGVAHVNVPALSGGTAHDELFRIPTSRRSVVPIGPVRSVQGDPLGLVRREIVWTGSEDLFVHPRTVRVHALSTGWRRDLEGETTNDRSPSDVAFHTLRQYQPGDDRRHIHWRTSARQVDGSLMVREFVDTRRASLGLVLSLQDADYATDEEFELAVSVVASLGARALADEQQVVMVAGRRRLPSYHGASFLDGLAGVERELDTVGLAASTASALDVIGGASVTAIVSGSAADPSDARMAVQRLGPSVRSIVVRTDPGRDSTVAAMASAPTITLASLDDLPRLVWAVTGR